ncbi:MAG: hypothetical protein QMC83_06425 [Thermodesulfovibrionales bacterium]|nr:hypothetical protein [Thermodesulfovibrionales bacterium]
MDCTEKDNREDKKAVQNTGDFATKGQHVNEALSPGGRIKIKIDAEVGESLLRDGLKLLAWYLSREKDGLLRSELQNLINNKTEAGQNKTHIASHDEKALLETDQPLEEKLTSKRGVFGNKKITRRVFLSLAGLTGISLTGWIAGQKTGILKSDNHPEKMLSETLARYALENKLSPEQIKKLRYFSERGFKANDTIQYFTFLEHCKVEPYVFNSIPPTLEFQIYKKYFDHLKNFLPHDYLLGNLNPVIAYGVKRRFDLLQLESLCRAFSQHYLKRQIFSGLQTNSQLLDTLFEDFTDLDKEGIQYYIAVLDEKVRTSSIWDEKLTVIIQKMQIMEAIKDYGKDLGMVVINKERAARLKWIKHSV